MAGLQDVQAAQAKNAKTAVFSKRYTGKDGALRRIAHKISDDLTARLTGEQGVASTRIVYVREVSRGIKEIFQVDRDGAGIFALTAHRSLTISPTVAADGRLAYVTYKGGAPEIWGQRTSTEVIRQNPGSDPSAVLFDAIQAGRARQIDYVIADTAGRLHTKSNLMAELEKMRRTAGRLIPGAPHEVLLVMDATTGQNGLSQAREFLARTRITDLILTKLDEATGLGSVFPSAYRSVSGL